MGLEPMTSPLPRECSTTELHQPLQPTLPSYRERRYPITMRKAKKPSRIHASDRNFPGSMVCQTSTPSTANAASAIRRRPLPAGLRSTTAPTYYQKNGAQGRIRTSVAHNAADLQSAAINHSATCAFSASRHGSQRSAPAPRLQRGPVETRAGEFLEGVV